MYAIIETGGKQYRVSEGDTVKVDSLGVSDGSTVEFDKVLFIGDGENVTLGAPLIEGAKVLATAIKSGRDRKIIVYKFKAKVRYRRKKGHRQAFTMVRIDKIVPPQTQEVAPRRRRTKKEVSADGA